ncbi:MAG: hypothetical protein IPK69_09320 [Phycisphaerales bacterium]|nr:MAG: hypothetical protein IPK69_09320 [Phycisphaerales bacterium]
MGHRLRLAGGTVHMRAIVAALVLVSLVLSPRAVAQSPCGEPGGWESLNTLPGIDGHVSAMIRFDPDDGGPRGACVVVGGAFTAARDILASNIVLYDPMDDTFETLGAGLNGMVSDLAVLQDGNLLAAGSFTRSGDATTRSMAVWDVRTRTWSEFAGGADSGVGSVERLANGDIAIGGGFTHVGMGIDAGGPGVGVEVFRRAIFDGTTWRHLGDRATDMALSITVWDLKAAPTGDLYARVHVRNVVETPNYRLSRWDGMAWHDLPDVPSLTFNSTIAVTPDGRLIVRGVFTTLVTTPSGNIAIWTPTGVGDQGAWSTLGSGLEGGCFGIAVDDAGAILAVGLKNSGSGTVRPSLFRWEEDEPGSGAGEWIVVAPEIGGTTPYEILPWDDGGFFVGESFTTSSRQRIVRFGRFVPTGGSEGQGAYMSLGGGIVGTVYDTITLENSDILAGGDFGEANGAFAYLARRVSATGTWERVGGALDQQVFALTRALDGSVIVGGGFQHAGAMSARTIARLDPVTNEWSTFGDVLSSNVAALAILPDGSVLATGGLALGGPAGLTRVARWTGTAWEGVGAGMSQYPGALAIDAQGNPLLGQPTSNNGGVPNPAIARLEGTTWTAVGGITASQVNDLALAPNGDILAAGSLTIPGVSGTQAVARFDGTAWNAIGGGVTGTGQAILARDNGDLILGGSTLVAGGPTTPGGAVALGGLASFNASAPSGMSPWSTLGTGISYGVFTLTLDREGNLIAGGTFSIAGGVISPSMARYRFATPACCPADLDDGSATGTRDAAVTIDDLLFFIDRYATGDDAADLDDGSGDGTSDGAVTIDDLLFFVTRFAQGC